ncbi:MAG: T9SS type A sorting domain-containing protein, partial [Salibacteraceae bacterium]
PNNGNFRLNYKTELEGDFNMEVINIMGKKVFTSSFTTNSIDNSINFNESLKPGTYFIRISQVGKTKTLKFLVN